MLPLADHTTKRPYRVRPGCSFGTFDEIKPGDLVELTDYEAQGFRDKLVLVVDEALTSVPDVLDIPAGVDQRKVMKRGKRG